MSRGRRLFVEAEPDVRPTLLGVVTLLFLLLFFLLSTSSGVRLSVIDLRNAGPGEAAPLPHSGLVQQLRIYAGPSSRIEYEVQSTDIAAAATSRELRREDCPDLAALERAILAVHEIDPAQQRATVHVDDALTADELLRVLDVVRGPDAAPRFPQVALR